MSSDADQAGALLHRARAGDVQALAALFDRYRDRLRHMVCLRLDRRLAGRLDASDVLQEAYLEAHKRLAGDLRDPSIPIFLWLRLGARRKLTHPPPPPLRGRTRAARGGGSRPPAA